METRPTAEQLRLRSSKTGDHSLDSYLEAAEKGSRTLADILSDVWDDDGILRGELYQFRFNSTLGLLQYRVGDFVDPNAGWVSIPGTSVIGDLAAITAAMNAAIAARDNAAASATSASGSATTASTKANDATASAAAAAGYAAAAADILDQFDDRYLGSKTSDPATDNDGNPLLVGALYFNPTTGQLRAWDGTVWKAVGGGNLVSSFKGRTGDVTPAAGDYTAAQITGTAPSGTSGTNMQAIIDSVAASLITKLNATAYNASDVLSKLLTVDGSGSGLDADMLDGQDSAFFRNASNLNAGTIPDLRLPGRLGMTGLIITDWNTVEGNGWFMAFNAANAPHAGWSIGHVIVHNSDWITQELFDFTTASSTDGRRYRRHKQSGSWGSWYRVYDGEGELNARYARPNVNNVFTSVQTIAAPYSALYLDDRGGNASELAFARNSVARFVFSYLPDGRLALNRYNAAGTYVGTDLIVRTDGVVEFPQAPLHGVGGSPLISLATADGRYLQSGASSPNFNGSFNGSSNPDAAAIKAIGGYGGGLTFVDGAGRVTAFTQAGGGEFRLAFGNAGGVSGGLTVSSTALFINGNTALHAGNYSGYSTFTSDVLVQKAEPRAFLRASADTQSAYWIMDTNGTTRWIMGRPGNTRDFALLSYNSVGNYIGNSLYCYGDTLMVGIEQLRIKGWNWVQDAAGRNKINLGSGGDNYYNADNSGGWNHMFQVSGGTRWLMEGAGNFYAQGNIVAYWSDRRLKEKLKRITDYRAALKAINVYEFEWNKEGRKLSGKAKGQREVGFIAQEVRTAWPQAVAVQPLQFKDDKGTPRDDLNVDPNDPYITVLEDKLLPLLFTAVKDMAERIETLEAALNKKAA